MEKFQYNFQLSSLLRDNYGISYKDYLNLLNTKYTNLPSEEIIKEIYTNISKQKIYRILETDNYGSDYPNEYFISFIDSEGNSYPLEFNCKEEAQVIANAFNQIRYNGNNRFFKEVEKNYKLTGSFEP